eukprot:TRINITY_DN43061_c0_g1_i1.p1 TRINITY_DN43061_c0_g1~~TRINITY_DN43061_c0_g1_i1.p1  ORF type:complete len:1131 (+),score=302.05 TRINITY_DN43061_c0_g1_i1:84-3476(+)
MRAMLDCKEGGFVEWRATLKQREHGTWPRLEDEDVGNLDVYYSHPGADDVHLLRTFCQPEEWDATEGFFKARMLVSASFVNLLSEAVIARRARHMYLHSLLERVRFGYLCDLPWLRRTLIRGQHVLQEIAANLPPEEALEEQPPGPKKGVKRRNSREELLALATTLPMQTFLLPEVCTDKWEKQGIKTATTTAREALERELAELRKKQNETISWEELMEMALKADGQNAFKIAQALIPPSDDELLCKEVENKLSNGLRDQLDQLLRSDRKLGAVLEDESQRGEAVEGLLKDGRTLMQRKREQIAELQTKLQVKPEREQFEKIEPLPELKKLTPPVEVVAAPEPEPADDSHFREQMEKWETELANAKKALVALRARLKGVTAPKDDELDRLERMMATLRAKLEKLAAKARSLPARREDMERRWADISEAVAKIQGELLALEQKIASQPPPPDTLWKYKEWQQQLAAIQEAQRLREQMMKERLYKIGMLKKELREYTRPEPPAPKKKVERTKEVEEVHEILPYWKRRRASVEQGDLNPWLLNASESSYKKARASLRGSQIGEAEKSANLLKAVAGRRSCWQEAAPRQEAGEQMQHGSKHAMPFAGAESRPDDAQAAQLTLSTTSQRAAPRAGSKDLQPLPAWAGDPQQLRWRYEILLQINAAKSGVAMALRSCAADFEQALLARGLEGVADTPSDAGSSLLAAAAAQMLQRNVSDCVSQLEGINHSPGIWEETCGWDELLAEIHGRVHEHMKAVALHDASVSMVSSATLSAISLEKLMSRLTTLRQSERELREELRTVMERVVICGGGHRSAIISPLAMAVAERRVDGVRKSTEADDACLSVAQPPLALCNMLAPAAGSASSLLLQRQGARRRKSASGIAAAPAEPCNTATGRPRSSSSVSRRQPQQRKKSGCFLGGGGGLSGSSLVSASSPSLVLSSHPNDMDSVADTSALFQATPTASLEPSREDATDLSGAITCSQTFHASQQYASQLPSTSFGSFGEVGEEASCSQLLSQSTMEPQLGQGSEARRRRKVGKEEDAKAGATFKDHLAFLKTRSSSEVALQKAPAGVAAQRRLTELTAAERRRSPSSSTLGTKAPPRPDCPGFTRSASLTKVGVDTVKRYLQARQRPLTR